MRIKDVVDVGHILGKESRFASDEEEAGVDICIGAVKHHLGYVYGEAHVEAFVAAVVEAEEGRWA